MNTQKIIDFIADGWLAELSTKQEFERLNEIKEKEMLAAEIELNELSEKDILRNRCGI